MRADRRENAYLTVFLSLSITIILSLILTLVYGVRVGAMKLKLECVSDIAMNSVLAEYHKELFDQYDLLMVDTSYGSAYPGIINAEERLRYYVDSNFDKSIQAVILKTSDFATLQCSYAEIPEYSLACDNNGAVFRRQILEYMKAEPITGMLSEVTQNIEMLNISGFDSRDVEAEADSKNNEINEMEKPMRENEDGEMEEVPINNPADEVNAKKSLGLLSLILPKDKEISGSSVNLSRYCSNRDKLKGTGLSDEESLSEMDALLIDQYIFEKCSFYSKGLSKSELKYQIEYLIGEKGSDRENLESVARKLLFWKEASNALYIFNDSEKKAEAKALATAVSAVTLSPELLEAITISILFAWSFAESICDLKALFSGGRAPLVKTAETWKTSLKNMADFDGNDSDNDIREGLNYEEYLRMMLFMKGMNRKTELLMDVMEMDIRRTKGNSEFRIDGCMDCYTAEIEAIGSGYCGGIRRTYGYEEY